MSNRLNIINSYIDEEDRVVDVGCDHALLSSLLANRGIKSIASDVNKEIIERRKKENFSDLITFMVSDGLKSIDESLYDTVVISGMGTNTIIDIISASNKNFKKAIIVSNKDYYDLRKYMTTHGFKITLEHVIYEKKKYYNLIIFEKGNEEYSYKDYLLGVNHQDKETYKSKNEYKLKKYESILSSIPLDKEEDITLVKEIINEYKKEINGN